MNPKGKNIWITGASDGIGRALALEAAAAGAARLLLLARRGDRLAKIAQECIAAGAATADYAELDLGVPDAIPHTATAAEKRYGPPDILILAAGVGQRGTALATNETTARRIMEVDYWGPVTLSKTVVPAMMQRGSGQIVVVTSLLGKFGAARRSTYSAAKHALHGWFESLGDELYGSGVKVTFIVPGWVRTAISDSALEEDGSAHGVMDAGQQRGISAAECARRAMAAIERETPEQLVGGWECGAAWLQRLCPRLLRRIIRQRGIG